jgi:hypothetical protein
LSDLFLAQKTAVFLRKEAQLEGIQRTPKFTLKTGF